MNRFRVLLTRLTAHHWNALISKVLCRAYARGIINSTQLHTLAKEFDPTQNGYISRIGDGSDFCSFEVKATEEERRRWGIVGVPGA